MEGTTLIREKLNASLSKYKEASELIRTEKDNLKKANRKLECSQESRLIFQEVSKAIQEEAHSKIASVVTKCLQTVFDDPYEFKIIFDTKRGRTEARLVFVRNDIEVDPMSASGGGVVDVAAFGLRLACLSLSRPPLRKILFLDEPFKFVSKEYRGRIKALLKNLTQEMEFQIFFVTHIPDLQCGNIVTIS